MLKINNLYLFLIILMNLLISCNDNDKKFEKILYKKETIFIIKHWKLLHSDFTISQGRINEFIDTMFIDNHKVSFHGGAYWYDRLYKIDSLLFFNKSYFSLVDTNLYFKLENLKIEKFGYDKNAYLKALDDSICYCIVALVDYTKLPPIEGQQLYGDETAVVIISKRNGILSYKRNDGFAFMMLINFNSYINNNSIHINYFDSELRNYINKFFYNQANR